MAFAKLSDKILAQLIVVEFMVASINGSHSRENLVLSGLPNNLHSIVVVKLEGGEIDAV